MMRLSLLIALLCPLLFVSPLFAADEEEKEGEEQEATQLAYHSLSPSLIANVHGSAKYMRCDVQLMTKDEANIPDIELHAPALRHQLLLLFSDQQGKDIQGVKGKERLRVAALKAVRATMKELTGKEMLDDLFFTSYFVQ